LIRFSSAGRVILLSFGEIENKGRVILLSFGEGEIEIEIGKMPGRVILLS
jgi:hypothetical protein